MTPLVLWMLLHFLAAVFCTWLARRYALHRKLVDHPGDRRSHSVATPRGGGISIVFAVLLGMGWMLIEWSDHRLLLSCMATGLVLVAGIGWIDDHRPLSPGLRLAVQGVAALVLAWGFHRTYGAILPALIAFVLVMVLVNIWNFMDGIDGLAASQAALVAGGLALLLGTGPWGWLAAALAAACMGFLPFNFPKAGIFLGDVGSGALGYLVAGLLAGAYTTTQVAWPLLLLPLAAFLVDAGFTLARRMLAGERWWTPHVTHAYQVWAKRTGSHVRISVAYGAFTLAGVILMLGGISLSLLAAAWMGLLWYVFTFLLWARLRRDVPMSKETEQ
jgi:UDP-N-acetylmuramyl pentapeptide phosphotransferase/UDP-N-acetylglucosamine-1-phosphate transferase